MLDLDSEEKKLKNSWKWIKKNWKVILITSFFNFSLVYLALRLNIFPFSNFGLANISQSINFGQNQLVSDPSKAICEGGMFTEKLDNWNIASYNRPDEDGFYCPRSTKKFLYSNIWYKTPIPTDFDSIELRYKLRNKDNSTTKPPSLILSISQWGGFDILHFYVPEENYQIAGFEKIVKKETGFSLQRENIKELDEPIEYGTEAELKTRIRIIEKNKVGFDFNLKYISALNGESIENGFSYEVDLPVPNPESELSKLQIGFGTFQGNCIKPVSYKFCY